MTPLKPFFRYFGSKHSLVARGYPKPRFDTIVEPFAGSAAYACHYHDRKVLLCDVNPVVVGVWDYLIKASPIELLELPDVLPGQDVREMGLCQEAQWLIGFWIGVGEFSRTKATNRSEWSERTRMRLASQAQFIRHWRIRQCSYEQLECDTATWFVDPPYIIRGSQYKNNGSSKNLNFQELASWCRTRPGQVIVCENKGATWLPFYGMSSFRGSNRKSVEAIWVRPRQEDV